MNPTVEEIEVLVKKMVAEELEVDAESLASEGNFHHMGLDSISSIFMLNELEEKYKVKLTPMHLWNNPTIGSFANFVHTLIHESD